MDFRADHCHNVDRIFRLPGTVNLPNANKRKRGRVAVPAELISFTPDNIYALGTFTKAAIVQQQDASMIGGGDVSISAADVKQVRDVSELDEWNVPERVKVVMVQGRHPDEPKERDDSRSAWVFDFCCQLARCEVPDATILSVLLDPGWGISESVLETTDPEKYALRQIQRARESIIDPWLAYFNQRYAVIKKLGGRCLVITEVEDYALGRTRLMTMPLPDFEKGYENKLIEIGINSNGQPKFKAAGTWWRKHEKRRQFDTLTFAPEKETRDDCYNLWKGFAVKAVAGDCSLFLDHIAKNICAGNEAHHEYLIKWIARTVQHPGQPGEVAVVLRGGRGVGKSFFVKILGHLLGRHYMHISNSSHLIGNFNSHLRDLILLFADEAFYAGDRRHESILKTLVTEDTMSIESKGVDVETAPNFIHLIMASNDMHVVPAGGDERRFFVLDVAAHNQKDTAYFRSIVDQMEAGGYEALLHFFRTFDIKDYEVRDVPSTRALKEQKLLSLDADEDWWYQKLLQGQLLSDDEGWPDEIMNRSLVEDYIEYSRQHHLSKRSSEVKLGVFMQRVAGLSRASSGVRRKVEIEVPAGDGYSRKKMIRAIFHRIPSLVECRDRWERLNGSTEWPMDEEEEEELPF